MTRIAVGGTGPTGLKWPNYVNGRLLTAQDLTAGRDATFARDRWLGLAVGSGVADGLEVTGTSGSSVLQVSPGTGVSLGGTAVHLDAPATLDLTAVSSSAPATGAQFATCQPATTTTKAPTAGPYLLAMRPASSYDGKVPVLGSATATLVTPCTGRWEVEDVVFVAIRLDDFTLATSPANRRNLLAHWCLGSGRLEPLAMSGFTAPVPYRPIDALADLTSCDLALAVFDWTGTSLGFVDRWSARRRTVRPSAASAFSSLVDDRRTADGEARLLQFQEQIGEIINMKLGLSARALTSFPLLPPAALVPIDPPATLEALQRSLATMSTAAESGLHKMLTSLLADATGIGVEPSTFFAGVDVRLGTVDRETVDFTIRRSWYDEPIELGKGAAVNVFFVLSSDEQSVAPFVLFTKRLRGVRWLTSTLGSPNG